jgi:hypothetical protein
MAVFPISVQYSFSSSSWYGQSNILTHRTPIPKVWRVAHSDVARHRVGSARSSRAHDDDAASWSVVRIVRQRRLDVFKAQVSRIVYEERGGRTMKRKKMKIVINSNSNIFGASAYFRC